MEKKPFKKDKYKLNEPVLYPPLKKSMVRFEEDEEKSQDLGLISLNLIKLNEISIYKLLYNNQYNSDLSNCKNIRSEYLKKIVEVNDEFFPQELLLEKYKKRPDLTFEEKLKIKISMIKEKPKKRERKEKDKEIGLSRKVSGVEKKEEEELVKFKSADEQLNVAEEQGSEVEEENEEQSYEDEDFLQVSDEGDGVDGSDEANFSEGGAF